MFNDQLNGAKDNIDQNSGCQCSSDKLSSDEFYLTTSSLHDNMFWSIEEKTDIEVENIGQEDGANDWFSVSQGYLSEVEYEVDGG